MLYIIGIVAMLIDHVGKLYYPELIILRIIGRIAFPIFVLGIAEGMKVTKNKWKYIYRMMILAFITQFIYILVFETLKLSVIYELLFIMLFIKILETEKKELLDYLSLVILLFMVMLAEYSLYGLALALILYYTEDIKRKIGFIILTHFVFYYMLEINIIQFIALFFMIIIVLCKKYDFEIVKNKYIKYTIYPLHLLILYILPKMFITK